VSKYKRQQKRIQHEKRRKQIRKAKRAERTGARCRGHRGFHKAIDRHARTSYYQHSDLSGYGMVS
jgi:hypothetical protein